MGGICETDQEFKGRRFVREVHTVLEEIRIEWANGIGSGVKFNLPRALHLGKLD